MKEKPKKIKQSEKENKSFSHDVMAAILVDQNRETATMFGRPKQSLGNFFFDAKKPFCFMYQYDR